MYFTFIQVLLFMAMPQSPKLQRCPLLPQADTLSNYYKWCVHFPWSALKSQAFSKLSCLVETLSMFNLLVLKTCGFVAVTSAKLWSYWRRIQPCIASRPGTTKATNIPAATSACCTVWRPCPGWVGCSSDLSISYNLNPTGHLLRRYHQPESLLDVFKRNMCPSELQDSFS